MKFNTNNLFSYNVVHLTVFTALILGFQMDSRILFEVWCVIVTLLALPLTWTALWTFFLLIQFIVNGVTISAISSIYALLILGFVMNKVKLKGKLSIKILFSTSIVVAYFLLTIETSLFRPTSLFNSPTTFGMYSASLVLLPMFLNAIITIPLLVASGSRAALLLSVLAIYHKQNRVNKIIIFLCLILMFVILFSFSQGIFQQLPRSFSYSEVSDSSRLKSLQYFYDIDWSIKNMVFGNGRQYFGSLGRWEGYDVVTIESSIIGWAASYGLIVVTLWVFVYLYSVIVTRQYFWLIFLFIGSTSVVFDILGAIWFPLLMLSLVAKRETHV